MNTSDKLHMTRWPAPDAGLPVKWGLVAAILIFGVFLSGCQTSMPLQGFVTPETSSATGEYVSDLSDFVLPTPTPTPEIDPDDYVVVSTGGARANLRSGPGLDFPIVGKGYPGDAYQIVSQDESGEWWEICCIPAEEEGDDERTETAWVNASVVASGGNVESVDISDPLLNEDLEATWRAEWKCGSDRCAVRECGVTITASASDADQQWLSIDHDIVWDESCFSTDSWPAQVDRFTGKERSGGYDNNFLYGYWLGTEPGEANGVIGLDDGRQIAVWCSGPYDVEIPEGDGWTTTYEGKACHDVRTGMIVLLEYMKRWLYTGEYDGQNYDRAYFGDHETLTQILIDTNAELLFVEPAE
jgi:hypothetical protein